MSAAAGDPFDLLVVGTGSAERPPPCVAPEPAGASRSSTRALWRDVRAARLRSEKGVVGAAEALDWNERMRGSGIDGASRIDWADLMRFKRTFTQPAPAQREAQFAQCGVTMYHGRQLCFAR